MSSSTSIDRPVVLVVDDTPQYLDMLGSVLSGEYDVRTANSGQRALQLALHVPLPDLVILDVIMPGMNGHEVLAALRANPVTHDIPVIFVTTLDEASDELAGLTAGAADFIVKPTLPSVVKARVHTQVELKRARDRLRANNEDLRQEVARREQLEQALNRTVADLEAFSYTVSHDLRAPLCAIDGFAHALYQTEASSLTDKGRHRLERILAGAGRMSRMIDDILACSRAERVPMRQGHVDLGELVNSLFDELRIQWPDTRVQVDALPSVQGDASMLRQVFANLLGNAFKFSAKTDAPCIKVTACEVDGMTQVQVSDNGAGFDPEYAHKLFGLFQRLHKDSEFPGTGVGLAIVKRLVARHGGQISAHSQPGGWTTFSLTLNPATAST